METLHNFHFDFIKIKVPNVVKSQINWHNLQPHPNLRRHHMLSSNTGLEHYKNFDMYLSNRGDMVIRLSMPYLIFGHNYVAFDLDEVTFCIDELQRILGIDLQEALVEEFEYGCFESLGTTARKYLHNIQGLPAFDLVKATPQMRIYDNGIGVKYKVYDAIANAKRKKTFKRAGFKFKNVIKHEYKMVFNKSCEPVPVSWLLREKFVDMVERNLCGLIMNHKHILDAKEVDIQNAKTLNEILFVALKKVQQEYGIDTMGLTLKMIKQLNLTSSQKSKRTNAVCNLNQKFTSKID